MYNGKTGSTTSAAKIKQLMFQFLKYFSVKEKKLPIFVY